ncbi:MAG: DedA family protein [Bacilli bacterium]|nr:DedA family protein [Bacilli bacterium]
MEQMIIDLMNQFGYVGILFLIAIENIFPPIPSEVILTFGGFMTTYTKMNIVGVILFATIGSVIGALVLYGIGKLLNKERLEKIISGKIGKILRLKKKDIEKADYWFDTKGGIAVFIGRFIPIVRSLISIPAGMSEMPMGKFLILTTIGTLIWNTVLVILGSVMGSKWNVVTQFINEYAHIVLVILIIIFIIAVVLFYKGRIGKNKSTK